MNEADNTIRLRSGDERSVDRKCIGGSFKSMNSLLEHISVSNCRNTISDLDYNVYGREVYDLERVSEIAINNVTVYIKLRKEDTVKCNGRLKSIHISEQTKHIYQSLSEYGMNYKVLSKCIRDKKDGTERPVVQQFSIYCTEETNMTNMLDWIRTLPNGTNESDKIYLEKITFVADYKGCLQVKYRCYGVDRIANCMYESGESGNIKWYNMFAKYLETAELKETVGTHLNKWMMGASDYIGRSIQQTQETGLTRLSIALSSSDLSCSALSCSDLSLEMINKLFSNEERDFINNIGRWQQSGLRTDYETGQTSYSKEYTYKLFYTSFENQWKVLTERLIHSLVLYSPVDNLCILSYWLNSHTDRITTMGPKLGGIRVKLSESMDLHWVLSEYTLNKRIDLITVHWNKGDTTVSLRYDSYMKRNSIATRIKLRRNGRNDTGIHWSNGVSFELIDDNEFRTDLIGYDHTLTVHEHKRPRDIYLHETRKEIMDIISHELLNNKLVSLNSNKMNLESEMKSLRDVIDGNNKDLQTKKETCDVRIRSIMDEMKREKVLIRRDYLELHPECRDVDRDIMDAMDYLFRKPCEKMNQGESINVKYIARCKSKYKQDSYYYKFSDGTVVYNSTIALNSKLYDYLSDLLTFERNGKTFYHKSGYEFICNVAVTGIRKTREGHPYQIYHIVDCASVPNQRNKFERAKLEMDTYLTDKFRDLTNLTNQTIQETVGLYDIERENNVNEIEQVITHLSRVATEHYYATCRLNTYITNTQGLQRVTLSDDQLRSAVRVSTLQSYTTMLIDRYCVEESTVYLLCDQDQIYLLDFENLNHKHTEQLLKVSYARNKKTVRNVPSCFTKITPKCFTDHACRKFHLIIGGKVRSEKKQQTDISILYYQSGKDIEEFYPL